MPAYSQDLRDRVLDALEREERPSRIAQRFVVSRSCVYQVRDRLLKDGKRTALQVGGYRRSRIEHLQLTLSSWIQEQSDLTLEEICVRLSELGIKIQLTAVWHQLDKWGLSFKKNPTRQRARTRRRAASA
ncbi:MAG: IS630 transposase-related protein [Betaproteobacteria bacterium]|nr:IS630 transposase-related protein [Betaproteobacteria bacterium]